MVLLSGSRKQNKSKRTDKGSSKAQLDPNKLAMVSDYLKRTIAERPYGFILASLAERLRLDELDFRLSSMGLIPVPPGFDIRKFQDEKSIGFVPYCCKPFDCPLNIEEGRKSKNCKAITSRCDHPICTIGRFIEITKKLGVEDFYVIDSDADLFRWLAEKKNEGFKHVIGVACEFAVSYALEVINVQLEFDGLIVLINGDKCRTKEEYAEMDTADRGRLTFIDDWTLATLEELANQVYGEQIPEEEDESAVVDR